MRKFLIFFVLLLAVFAVTLAVDPPEDVDSQYNYSVLRMFNDGVLYTNPQNWHVLFDDFDGFPAEGVGSIWDSTMVWASANEATLAPHDSLGGGIIKIVLPTNGKSNGMSLQAKYMGFPLRRSPSKPDSAQVQIDFETRLMSRDVTQIAIIAGMIEETDAVSGTTNGVYFYTSDGSDSLFATIEFADGDSSYTTPALMQLEINTWYRFGIGWQGRYAKFFVNDQLLGQLDTGGYGSAFMTDGLKPTFQTISGDSVAKSLYIDYISAKQRR